MPLLCALVTLAPWWAGPASAQWPPEGLPVCTAPMNQQYPRMVEDGQGGAFIAWRDQRDSAATNFDIYAQRIDANGVAQWAPNGVPVCTVSGKQINPHLTADGAGGVIIAWEDLRSGSRYQIYTQRLSASGAPVWGAGGVLLRDHGLSQFLPSPTQAALVPDGTGGAIVVWDETVTGTDADIRAQRIDGAGTLLWTAAGVAVCTAGVFQIYATLAADGAGGALIAWEDWRFWPVAHIYAQRLSATGQPQWTLNGIRVSSLAGDQREVSLIPDGNGGALMAYRDEREGDPEIYAQRVNGAGQLQWAADGVPLCTIYGGQRAPFMVTDGSGGGIVAWEDTRTNPTCLGGCPEDVYAQRVNAAGEPQWASDGVDVCVASGDQRFPVLAADGAGGAIVAWHDAREPALGSQIYAQRLDALGAPQGAVDGVPLTGGVGGTGQGYPVAVPDGAGGAIVAWMDWRQGQCWKEGCIPSDIYATRVMPVGSVSVPELDAPAFHLLAPHPNPMAATTRITFALPAAGPVTVEILDLAGQRVRIMARAREYPTGTHTLTWDGRDGAGRRLPSGIYLLRLSATGIRESRKIVVLR